MKVLLVRPPRIKQAITVSDFMFSEPLGLEMIYGVIKEDHDVEIFDMMIETMELTEKLNSYNPDVLGITSLCIDVNKVIELCVEAKRVDKRIITVIGGTQTYLNPEAFIHDAVDHILEYIQRENLKKFFNLIFIEGKIIPIDGIRSRVLDYKSTGKKCSNEYLLPDRASTEKYRNEYSYFGYQPAAIMEFGMGCEKVCDFCLRWRIEGVKERLIDLEITKRDLVQIKEPTIMFIDNDFFASEEKIKTFIKLVKELDLKKNYIVYGSVKGIIEYKDIIEEFVELGLKAVLVGYETFNEVEMEKYRKKSTIEDSYKAATILRELGIDAWASFMAHPDWNKRDFQLFRAFIEELRPQISSVSPLTPFPNLPMYKQYENRLLYKKEDYEKWSFGQVIIKPSKISLRRYYCELLKTNLYINLFINKNTKMIHRYGINNIFRIIRGSLKSVVKYINLMIKA